MRILCEVEEVYPYAVWIQDDLGHRLRTWRWANHRFGLPLGPRNPTSVWRYDTDPAYCYRFKYEEHMQLFKSEWGFEETSRLFMMVGIPASGKSTWIESQKFNWDKTVLISTDKFIKEYGDAEGKSYNDVFESYYKIAEQKMYEELDWALRCNLDIVWDQTNVTANSRKKKLALFPNHYIRKAIVIEIPSDDVYDVRLQREGKHIPQRVAIMMKDNFEYPTFDEGFDGVYNIKQHSTNVKRVDL